VSRRLRASLLALCVTGALTACDSGGKEAGSTQAPTGSTERSPTIESSLEGFRVLPPHIRWTATTSLPAEDVRAVRFIVDGSPIWTDFDSPYSYGEEGAYLATRSFSYGEDESRHRFTVRVEATNGERRSETVEARVPEENLPRSFPPFNYTIWERLSAADLKSPTLPEDYPFFSETGHIHFVGSSLHVGRTRERAFAYEIISMDRKSLQLGVPIFFGSHERGGQVAGFHFKGFQCAVDGPPAAYALSTGRYGGKDHYATYIRLKAVDESCEQRRRLIEGAWAPVD
jgi:hypothetical protein